MTYYAIALIILGIIAVVGIVYVQIEGKHLSNRRR